MRAMLGDWILFFLLSEPTVGTAPGAVDVNGRTEIHSLPLRRCDYKMV